MARFTRKCLVVFTLLLATVGFAAAHEREGHRRSHYHVRSGDVYYTGHVHYYSVPRYTYRYCPEDREYYCEECYEDYDHYVPRGRVHVDIVVNPFGYRDHYYYYRHRHRHDEDEDDD